jgi:hypothetical protein
MAVEVKSTYDIAQKHVENFVDKEQFVRTQTVGKRSECHMGVKCIHYF